MTLLMRHAREKAATREAGREKVRAALRESLRRHLPGVTVWVYGSLCRPGAFNEWSDADIALEELPSDMPLGLLQSLISRDIGIETDVCVLDETRLAPAIREKGERWIP